MTPIEDATDRVLRLLGWLLAAIVGQLGSIWLIGRLWRLLTGA